jgi:hypothetical protein
MLTREEMERIARANGHHDVALLLALPREFMTVGDIPPAMLADLLRIQQEIMKCKK